MDSEQNCITIDTIQRREENFSLFVLVQRGLKILRDRNIFLRSVCRVPATVLLGCFDYLKSCGLHLATGNESFSFFSIDLRPDALGSTRGEFLKPVFIIKSLFLSINPTIAQSNIQ